MQITQNIVFRAIVLAVLLIVAAIVLFQTNTFQPEQLRSLRSLTIEPATFRSDAANVFGLGQFLATLALLVTIFNVSDFRYRYRLAVRRFNIRLLALYASATLAGLLIIVEVWFQAALPIPHIINNYGIVKLSLGAIFVGLVLIVVGMCFKGPAPFTKGNSDAYFEATNHFIHQGNKERMQAVAEEAIYALPAIFRFAGDPAALKDSLVRKNAIRTLLTFADRRFCNLIVDRVPTFALEAFKQAALYEDIPFSQFARNIGEAFIFNTESAFYQEESGFDSGYFGYAKPITRLVFGNYTLIERCARDHQSPLDLRASKGGSFGPNQMEGFLRACIAFTDNFLTITKGLSHSYTFARMVGSFEGMSSSLYELDGKTAYYGDDRPYRGLQCASAFITHTLKTVESLGITARTKKRSKQTYIDVYDSLADLQFEIILNASFVTKPEMTCWMVQFNGAWKHGLRYGDSKVRDAFEFKVRRLIYDEIRGMDRWPNFKGARILGFCLNVLGLEPIKRHQPGSSHLRSEYALQLVVLAWTKRNFKRMVDNNTEVANACLQGWISYDRDRNRLVRGGSDRTRNEQRLSFLDLD